MDNLRIAWLFPDTLYLHGERGNVLALIKIGTELGLDIKVDKINLEDSFDPDNYDIIYVSAGELNRAKSVVDKLKDIDLDYFIKSGRPLIVTGNSISYFGKNIKRVDGENIEGLGLIDIESTENDHVYGDDIYFKTTYNDKPLEILGNQIQMVDIESNDKPFGDLLYGYGNNGNDRNEGVIINNSIFTNTLGPLLICNPWLTKEVLEIAAKNKGLEIKEDKTNFDLEKKSLNSKINYIKNKKSDLKNCPAL